MNFLLVTSNKDKASINFKEVLFSKYNLISINNYSNLYKLEKNNLKNKIFLKIIDSLHIHVDQEQLIEKEINEKIDTIIFLSKHATLSDTKPKCMTVHAVGNFSKAEFGGKDNTLVETDPILIRKLLMELKFNKNSIVKSYEVKQEATHHGPYLEIPTIFFEIGSGETDWKNKDVSNYMIDILIKTISNYNKESVKLENNWEETVGYGGSHYCTKFNKHTLNKNNMYCFGHIIPNYALEYVKNNKDLLKQALDKSNSKKILKENLEDYLQ